MKRGALALLILTACGDTAPPTPIPTTTTTTPAVVAVTVDTLAAPTEGNASLAWPARLTTASAQGHERRTLPARFGASDDAGQLLFGARDAAAHASVTFYAHGLVVGTYDVQPDVDETAQAHAGGDDRIAVAALSIAPRDLRSVSGTVHVTESDDHHVSGDLDVVVQDRARQLPEPLHLVGRFVAIRDRYIDGWLAEESTVRAQLREHAKQR